MQEYEQWPGVLSADGMGVSELDLRRMGEKGTNRYCEFAVVGGKGDNV